MCGIAGILGTLDREKIVELAKALEHRGPDGQGFYSHGDLHLGMTRLSVIDPEGGNQPILNDHQDKAIVFNGEIYNHKELRESLIAKGHTFSTRSDTEVILRLYEDLGERCVEHLNGMFAFAIADGDRLFLARDRIGIKPLFYCLASDHRTFIFASEVKALLRCPEVEGGLDPQAFADNIALGYPTERATIFRGVETVKPGEYILVQRQDHIVSLRHHCYYNLSLRPDPGISLESAEFELLHRLRTVVQTHMEADVDIGIALSGGLDSSILAFMLDQQTHRSHFAFTTGTSETHPDVVHSRAVSRQTKLKHDVFIPSFRHFLEQVPGCIFAEERPTSLTAMPFFMLCQVIGSKVKVCLNGEGADELFGGYSMYADPHAHVDRLKKRLAWLRRLGMNPSERTFEIFDKLSHWESFDDYLAAIFDINLREQLLHFHLGVADRYAMASGVEIRVPYLDHVFVEFVNRLPLSYKLHRQNDRFNHKYILKRVACSSFGAGIRDIIARPKLGFPSAGATYLARLKNLCDKFLPRDYLKKHEMGHCFANKIDLVVFEIFQEFFLKRRGEMDAGFSMVDFLKSRFAGGMM